MSYLFPVGPIGSDAKSNVQSLRRTGGWIPFRSIHLRRMQIFFRTHLQQSERHSGMQKQLSMCRRQEEQNGLQGLPTAKMSDGGHVQVRFTVWSTVKLVQDSLSDATIAR